MAFEHDCPGHPHCRDLGSDSGEAVTTVQIHSKADMSRSRSRFLVAYPSSMPLVYTVSDVENKPLLAVPTCTYLS